MKSGDMLGGRFEIMGPLGRGGMATVYLARDGVRDEQVALKVLHPHLAADPAARGRLVREVQAAARLQHPNVLAAREIHEHDGQLMLSMPVHRGATLADQVATEGPLSAEVLQRTALELTDALACAHARGVVHRDVNPNNAMIDAQGSVLADFGLAGVEGHATATATAAGTWGYTAPEVFDGHRADARSDLYSLGATLYYAATGSDPFASGSPSEVLQRQQAGALRPLAEARPDLPSAFVAQVESMLSPDPAGRPLGARSLHDALLQGEAPEPGATRRTPEPVPQATASEGLPFGMYTVIVGSRGKDVRRRELFNGTGAIQREENAAPEWTLSRKVAELGGPSVPAALPEVMRRTEYKLVEGVSRETAEALCAEAVRLGLAPRMKDDPNILRSAKAGQTEMALATVFYTAAVMGSVVGFVDTLMPILALAVVFFGLGGWFAYKGLHTNRLHLAFANSLANADAPPADAREESSSESAQPADALEAVYQRARAQLDLLEQSLDASEAKLPAQALADLRDSHARLSARARSLVGPARKVQQSLAISAGPEAALGAARIAARITRLRTLGAAGDPVNAEELARLEHILRATEDELRHQEHGERAITLATARLLEIAAAAARAVRTLSADGTRLPAHTAEDLVADLDAQVRDATEALGEVEAKPLPRENVLPATNSAGTLSPQEVAE